MEPFMTSQEKADLYFRRKQDQLADGRRAMSEYEQRARAEREKTDKLRALRLARDAEASANLTTAPAKPLKKSSAS
jgi:hypothetical protein